MTHFTTAFQPASSQCILFWCKLASQEDNVGCAAELPLLCSPGGTWLFNQGCGAKDSLQDSSGGGEGFRAGPAAYLPGGKVNPQQQDVLSAFCFVTLFHTWRG